MANKIQIPLDKAPDHAAAIGRLLGHWAILENQLTDLMEILLHIDQFRAKFIYQEFVSTKSKILLLRRLNHFFTLDQNLKKEIDQLLSKANILNTKRNSFVHAIWAAGNPPALTMIKTTMPGDHKKRFKPFEQFSPQDIQNVVEEIAELSQSFQNLLLRGPIILTKQPLE